MWERSPTGPTRVTRAQLTGTTTLSPTLGKVQPQQHQCLSSLGHSVVPDATAEGWKGADRPEAPGPHAVSKGPSDLYAESTEQQQKGYTCPRPRI